MTKGNRRNKKEFAMRILFLQYGNPSYLQLRISKIIDDRVNLLPGLAEWAVVRRIGLIVYEIIRMKDRMDRIILDLQCH